jgi:hypothetical protein
MSCNPPQTNSVDQKMMGYKGLWVIWSLCYEGVDCNITQVSLSLRRSVDVAEVHSDIGGAQRPWICFPIHCRNAVAQLPMALKYSLWAAYSEREHRVCRLCGVSTTVHSPTLRTLLSSKKRQCSSIISVSQLLHWWRAIMYLASPMGHLRPRSVKDRDR